MLYLMHGHDVAIHFILRTLGVCSCLYHCPCWIRGHCPGVRLLLPRYSLGDGPQTSRLGAECPYPLSSPARLHTSVM